MTDERAPKQDAYDALVAKIRAADDGYYGDDAQTLTDAQYDALRLELKAMEDLYPDLDTYDRGKAFGTVWQNHTPCADAQPR